jgi:FAD/FMN-containing dehydrogenase
MLTSTSGYNVWNQSVGLKQMLDIVVGSEGTLGVITSVTLRVVPLTKHTYTLVTGVSSLTEAHKVADIYKHHNCDTLSLSDSSLFKEDSIPQGTHVPSFIQNLRSPYLLTGTFIAKEESVVHRTTHMCKEKIEKLCKEVSIEQGSTWASHKDTISTSVLKNFAEKKYSIITTFDSISLPHNSYATCSEKIATFLEEVGCAYTLGGHIGSSQLSVIFFTDTSIHLGKEIMESVSKTITDIVESVHGSITGGNGDGIIRTPCINVSSDTHIRNLYREIQQLFDPEQIFNAGKKTFLTSGYTLRHTHNPKA